MMKTGFVWSPGTAWRFPLRPPEDSSAAQMSALKQKIEEDFYGKKKQKQKVVQKLRSAHSVTSGVCSWSLCLSAWTPKAFRLLLLLFFSFLESSVSGLWTIHIHSKCCSNNKLSVITGCDSICRFLLTKLYDFSFIYNSCTELSKDKGGHPLLHCLSQHLAVISEISPQRGCRASVRLLCYSVSFLASRSFH